VVVLALNRKLLRDLWRLRGQVLAIGLVRASGVGLLVMSLTALEALDQTAAAYYERYRFADVFARVKRAPEHLASRLSAIEGVESVETRVVRSAILDVEGFDEPVIGQLVSIPENREPRLNRLAVRQGRLPRMGAPDEVVLSEPFAEAHGLQLGGRIRAIINGRWRTLDVVGIALSPEYVYSIGPGALMPDQRRYGVLWLGQTALQAAFDLDSAFDDVSLGLRRGADVDAVIAEVDRLLGRYGGVGAYAREDQLSNWFLMNEIQQLKTLARILPTIFLAVAAFLTNMVLARLIAIERGEIGLLKAFGYSTSAIAWHYVKLVLAIGAIGIVLGAFAGYWLGLYNTTMYAQFYRFPFLLYRPGPSGFVLAAMASLAAALLGAATAVRRAAALPPAEAMRPPAPPLFRRSRIAGSSLAARLDQPTRIVLRQAARWPARSLVTSAGIGLGIAVLITSMQWLDAIDHMVDVHFLQAQAQDVTVGFSEARSIGATLELARLPGVLTSEPNRSVAAKMRSGLHEEREALQGLPAHQELHRVYDAQGRAVDLPADGLVISTALAQRLDVGIGDRVEIEVLEGRRDTHSVPVVNLFETYIGSPAYIEIGALSRLLHEGASATSVHLRVDAAHEAELFRALKQIPAVASVTVKRAAVETFHETMAKTLLIYVSFFMVFSTTLAIGVTYNAARIALSERSRELATLRVLGFSRAEISYILVGEIGLLTLLALPLGVASGFALAKLIVRGFDTELFRVPFVIAPGSYGLAILIGVVAAAGSVLLVRRRLDRLDLIGVLKTRE
jgi:putative ABC transport system permease protein